MGFAEPFETRCLRVAIASIWLLTGVLVVHPHYRAVGEGWLAPLGLPGWVMFPVCLFEIGLAVRILMGPMTTALAAVQVAMVGGFTLILAALDPALLVHPFGLLTKNIPLLALIGVAWLLPREGWTPRTTWGLRVGMAVIWISEGIFPKILFQQEMERDVVARTGLVPMDPEVFLVILGVAQAISGVLALTLRGRPLRFVVGAQIAGLVALPTLVSAWDPLLWVHPFGPMTKNIPIILGSILVYRRLSRSS